jgi:hypothetical protein
MPNRLVRGVCAPAPLFLLLPSDAGCKARVTRRTERQRKNGRSDLETDEECARRSKARQPSARSGADVRRHVRCSRAAMATDRWIQDVAGALEERGRQYAPDHCGVLDGYTTLSGGWLTACGTGSCPGVAPMPKLLGLRALPPAVKTRGAHDTLFDAPRCPVGRPSRRCRRSGGPETARRPARP